MTDDRQQDSDTKILKTYIKHLLSEHPFFSYNYDESQNGGFNPNPKQITDETYPFKVEDTKNKFMSFLMGLARSNKFGSQADLIEFVRLVRGVCEEMKSVPCEQLLSRVTNGESDKALIETFILDMMSFFDVKNDEEQKLLCLDSILKYINFSKEFDLDLLKSEPDYLQYIFGRGPKFFY